jgi:hypothetical protein
MPVRFVSDLKPNPYNSKIFDKSLQEDDPGLIYLTEDIHREGLRHPIFCRPDGMILDGERRWRAVTLLGWETVNTLEKDVPDDEVLDYIVRAVSSSRQSTMREQARIYLAYRMHLKATTKLPAAERRIQAMQRAHFSFDNPDLADQVVAVFKHGSAELQDKLLTDSLSVVSAYSLLYRGHTRPRLGKTGPQRRTLEKLQKELDAKYAAAPKDPAPDDADAVTGQPATFNEYRLDAAVETAFAGLVEPPQPPKPPAPVDLDRAFEESLEKLWQRDPPEKTLRRLIQCFATGVQTVHAEAPERAMRALKDSFDVLRPLLALGRDSPAKR